VVTDVSTDSKGFVFESLSAENDSGFEGINTNVLRKVREYE